MDYQLRQSFCGISAAVQQGRKLKIEEVYYGGLTCDRPGKTGARERILGGRQLRRGALGEGRARLLALRRNPGQGRPEPFLFLRGLPGRSSTRGAPADTAFQALL